MDMRSELEDIKERIDTFYADYCDWQSDSTPALKQELLVAQRSLERALENVEQDYDVVVNVVVTVRVRANDEDDAADQAIEKIDNVLDTNGYYCDIDHTEASPAID